jgi:hypothetical protein
VRIGQPPQVGLGPRLRRTRCVVRLAAFRTAQGQSPEARDAPEVRRLFDVIARPWSAWQAMTGENAPLERNIGGRRDFDVNLDGVARYGLLPDFFQDLRNVGLLRPARTPVRIS